MRRLAPRLLACALLCAGAAQAAPFTVDHLLQQQRLGPVSVDPSQRWLVAPVTAPYRTAPRWDLEDLTPMTITQLTLVDLTGKVAPRVLPARVGQPSDWGWSPGPYAPSGQRMAITRARGPRLEVGVLDLATGEVRWTGLYPVGDLRGRVAQWRSDDELLVLAKDPDAPSTSGVVAGPLKFRQAALWRAAVEGEAAVTVMGSGRYRWLTPIAAATRLMRVSALTGASQPLAQGDFIDLEISPDSKRAALIAQGESLAADPGRLYNTADPFRRFRLSVIGLDQGDVSIPCPDCDLTTDLLAWSPSGSALLVYARRDQTPRGTEAYWRIEPGSNRAAPLSAPGIEPLVQTTRYGSKIPRADWMGEIPLVLARRRGAADAVGGWWAWRPDGPVELTARLPQGPSSLEATTKNAVVVSQGAHLWWIDGGGRPRRLGEGIVIPGAGLPEGERLAFNNRPAVADLVVLAGKQRRPAAIDRGRLKAVALEATAGSTPILAAPKAQALVALARDAHGVETLALHRPGRPQSVVALLNAHLTEVTFSAPRPVTHPGPDGQPLTSWLYLPPGHHAGDRLPLVVIPYPGRDYPVAPASQAAPARQLFLNVQVLAGAGYAVLLPSLPVDAAHEPSHAMADRILAIAAAAAALEPALDVDRIGLWGHSYGGYAVLTAATQSPRFKAVVASAFAADLFSHYTRRGMMTSLAPDAGVQAMIDAGWSELGQGRMGAAPWSDPQSYVRNSPLIRADRITAPLMMFMGDFDTDPGQAMTMFGAMFRQNKDAVSVTYHGEGHVILIPAHIEDQHRRLLAFFAEHLGEPQPPEASLASQTRTQASR